MVKIDIEDLIDKTDLDEVKGIEINHYLSITEKIAIVKSLVEYLTKLDEYGMFYYDDIETKIAYTVMTVSAYTNIQVSKDDYKNYDILMKNRLFEQIVYKIGIDAENFEDLLYSALSDNLRKNDVNYVVARKSNDLIAVVDNTMKHLNGMLDKGDPNKIAKYLSKGIEKLADKMPNFSSLDIEKVINKEGLK